MNVMSSIVHDGTGSRKLRHPASSPPVGAVVRYCTSQKDVHLGTFP